MKHLFCHKKTKVNVCDVLHFFYATENREVYMNKLQIKDEQQPT